MPPPLAQHRRQLLDAPPHRLDLQSTHEQVGQPQRQAVDDDHVVTAIAAQDLGHGQRFFEGAEVLAAGPPVPGNSIAHLVIPGLGGSQEQPPWAQPPRQGQGQIALARACSAADEDQTW